MTSYGEEKTRRLAACGPTMGWRIDVMVGGSLIYFLVRMLNGFINCLI